MQREKFDSAWQAYQGIPSAANAKTLLISFTRVLFAFGPVEVRDGPQLDRHLLHATVLDSAVWEAGATALEACGSQGSVLNPKSQRKLLQEVLFACRLAAADTGVHSRQLFSWLGKVLALLTVPAASQAAFDVLVPSSPLPLSFEDACAVIRQCVEPFLSPLPPLSEASSYYAFVLVALRVLLVHVQLQSSPRKLFETATQHMLIWVLALRAHDAINEHGPTVFSPRPASVSNLCDLLIGHACFHPDVAFNLHDAFLASASLVSALTAEPRPVLNSAAQQADDELDAVSERSDTVSGSEADEELLVPAAAAASLAEAASGSSVVTAYQCALFHRLSTGMQDATRSSGIVASVPVLLDAYLASLAALKAREATAVTGRTAAATLRRDRRGDVVAAARKFSMFLELCLVVAPELRSGASTPLSALALRAVRYLLMAAARHRLYSISDDVAPHPQLCCLKRISSVAGLGNVFSAPSGDVLTARIGVAMQLLSLNQALVCDSLDAVLQNVMSVSDADALGVAAATDFLVALVKAMTRLRTLGNLLQAFLRAAAAVSALQPLLQLSTLLCSERVRDELGRAILVCPDRQLPSLWLALCDGVRTAWVACPSECWDAVSTPSKKRSRSGDVPAAPDAQFVRFSLSVSLLVVLLMHIRVTDVNAAEWHARAVAALNAWLPDATTAACRMASPVRPLPVVVRVAPCITALTALVQCLSRFHKLCFGYVASTTSAPALPCADFVHHVAILARMLWEHRDPAAAALRSAWRELACHQLAAMPLCGDSSAGPHVDELLAPPDVHAPAAEAAAFTVSCAAILPLASTVASDSVLASWAAWMLGLAEPCASPLTVRAAASRALKDARIAELPRVITALFRQCLSACESSVPENAAHALGLLVDIPAACVPQPRSVLAHALTVHSLLYRSLKHEAASEQLQDLAKALLACRAVIASLASAHTAAALHCMIGRADAEVADTSCFRDFVRAPDLLLHQDCELSEPLQVQFDEQTQAVVTSILSVLLPALFLRSDPDATRVVAVFKCLKRRVTAVVAGVRAVVAAWRNPKDGTVLAAPIAKFILHATELAAAVPDGVRTSCAIAVLQLELLRLSCCGMTVDGVRWPTRLHVVAQAAQLIGFPEVSHQTRSLCSMVLPLCNLTWDNRADFPGVFTLLQSALQAVPAGTAVADAFCAAARCCYSACTPALRVMWCDQLRMLLSSRVAAVVSSGVLLLQAAVSAVGVSGGEVALDAVAGSAFSLIALAMSSTLAPAAAVTRLVQVAQAVLLKPRVFRVSHGGVCHVLTLARAATAQDDLAPEMFQAMCVLLYTFLRHRLPAVEDCLPVLVQAVCGLLRHCARASHAADESYLLFFSRVTEEMVKMESMFRRYTTIMWPEYLLTCARNPAPSPRQRAMVRPALMALMSMTSPLELQLLHATLAHTPAARVMLKDLHALYQREYKFAGQV